MEFWMKSIYNHQKGGMTSYTRRRMRDCIQGEVGDLPGGVMSYSSTVAFSRSSRDGISSFSRDILLIRAAFSTKVGWTIFWPFVGSSQPNIGYWLNVACVEQVLLNCGLKPLLRTSRGLDKAPEASFWCESINLSLFHANYVINMLITYYSSGRWQSSLTLARSTVSRSIPCANMALWKIRTELSEALWTYQSCSSWGWSLLWIPASTVDLDLLLWTIVLLISS